MLPLLLSISLAATPADLAGRWSLERDASQPVDELLEAVGASWVTRQLAWRVSVTQEITVAATSVTIAATSTMGSGSETFPTDNSAVYAKSELGGGMRRCGWDGATLRCVSQLELDGGGTAELTVLRLVDDGGRMHQTFTLRLTDGRSLSADRVFRKG